MVAEKLIDETARANGRPDALWRASTEADRP
jgi:hypothetical protein